MTDSPASLTTSIPVDTRGIRDRRIPGLVIFSMIWMTMLVVLVVLQPVLPLPGPATPDYAAVRLTPLTDWVHPLGTDQLGRDILSRVISGAGVSLAVGVGSVLIALVLGTLIGTLAGYFGGGTDRALGWLIDILLAFPALIAMIAITTFLGPSLVTLIVALGVVSLPMVARVARSAARTYAQRDFVQAAKAMGTSEARIVTRDILPNIAITVLSFGITLVAIAIAAEGALSFLGLGVPPPQASWGGMMNEGRAQLRNAPWIVMIPAVVMCVTLLAINFIADWLGRGSDTRGSHV
ncbi:ABC transporter permease [Microbacterium sp. 18062]|uniref:ABC transporter permease n=1 Tax=Microbacterium sp. 18062 TaxID=2681410 RepID=UPI00135C48B4|nr:ABC transporter permease [Microbacterium sp. 18062]